MSQTLRLLVLFMVIVWCSSMVLKEDDSEKRALVLEDKRRVLDKGFGLATLYRVPESAERKWYDDDTLKAAGAKTLDGVFDLNDLVVVS